MLAFLVACGGAQKIGTAPDDVAKLRDMWTSAFNAKQLDAVIATYAMDAVFMPITGERIISSAAIKNLYERIWKQFTPHIDLKSRAIERYGDLAYDSGDYIENITAGESSLNIAGNYLFVYRHEAEGWKVIEQMWTEIGGDKPVQ